MGGEDDEPIRKIAGGLYEAATEPRSWTAALDRIAEFCGAWGAQLLVWDGIAQAPSLSVLSRDLDPAGGRAYAEHYGRIDPHRRLVDTLGPARLIVNHEHFDASFAARDPFYQEFLLPYGSRWVAGARLADRDGRAAYIGLHRRPADDPFDAAAQDRLRRLLPHLVWATEIHHRLSGARTASGAAIRLLDAVDAAALAVDAEGAVLVANRAAEAALAEGDPIGWRAGRLVVADSLSQARLMRAIAAAAGAARGDRAGSVQAPAAQAIALRREARQRPLLVLVAPLPDRAGIAGVPAALIHLVDPDDPVAADSAVLRAAFGLTPAEAEIAAALVAGGRLEDVAAARKVGNATVRTQLLAVFAKTGTRRQPELVALLRRCLLLAGAVPGGLVQRPGGTADLP